MGQDGSYHPLSQQLIQVHVQPGLFLRLQPHGLGLDGHNIVQLQPVVVLWVSNFTYVRLLSSQVPFAWD